MKHFNRSFLKPISMLLMLALILTVMPAASASAETSYKTYTVDGYIVEETLTVYSANNSLGISTLSGEQTKVSSKVCKIKSEAGDLLATYKLTGTFTYGTGAPAKCEAAGCSTSISDSHCKFTAKSAYASGNQAIGAYTLKTTILTFTNTFSDTVKITCSVNGKIS